MVAHSALFVTTTVPATFHVKQYLGILDFIWDSDPSWQKELDVCVCCRTKDMVLVGLVLSLLSLVVTLLSLHTYGTSLYSLQEFPAWANITRLENSSCHVR